MNNAQQVMQEIGVLRRRIDELQAAAKRELVRETLSERFDVLLCRAGRDKVAILLEQVQETIIFCSLKPYPESPYWVPGLLDFHGERVPVLDVVARVTQKPRVVDQDENIVICDLEGRRVGLIVDKVEGVQAVRRDELQMVPAELPQAPYMLGVLPAAVGSAFLLSVSCLLTLSEQEVA